MSEEDPITRVGTLVIELLPIPSCPFKLYPQQYEDPLLRIAHVWSPPAEIAVAPIRGSPKLSRTETGALRVVQVPSPRAPVELEPQHLTPPLAAINAQVWPSPATMLETPLVSVET